MSAREQLTQALLYEDSVWLREHPVSRLILPKDLVPSTLKPCLIALSRESKATGHPAKDCRGCSWASLWAVGDRVRTFRQGGQTGPLVLIAADLNPAAGPEDIGSVIDEVDQPIHWPGLALNLSIKAFLIQRVGPLPRWNAPADFKNEIIDYFFEFAREENAIARLAASFYPHLRPRLFGDD